MTEVRSFTLGEFPQPTGVGLRYGQSEIWLEAFLGSIGVDDFRELTPARYRRHAHATGICLGHALQAVHPPCPSWEAHPSYRVPSSLVTICSGAGLSNLLAIAYDYDVLGLGPD